MESDAMLSVFTIAQVHHAPYRGQTVSSEKTQRLIERADEWLEKHGR